MQNPNALDRVVPIVASLACLMALAASQTSCSQNMPSVERAEPYSAELLSATAASSGLLSQAQITIRSASTPESADDPFVYDDFGASEFDGAFHFGRWKLESDPNIRVEQGDQALVISVSGVRSRVTSSVLTMTAPKRIAVSRSVAFLEGRMMLSSDHQGGYMNLTIALNASPGGEVWWSQCGLAANANGPPHALCDFTNSTRNSQPEFSRVVPVTFDTWHVVRMEIDPEGYEISFYLDGRLIGRGIPGDSERLRGLGFARTLGTYVESNTSITAYVDYIKTAP
jgi:hypothetical protein